MTRTIVRVVAHCHALGVVHRDLKPENFLLASKDEPEPMLKATDFGLSAFFRPGQIFTDVVGSAYYVAPEVLRRSYGKEADIWSCGVVLYIMLSGVPPFWGETEQQIFDSVLKGELDLTSDPWPKISESAKDCVRRMLNPDPKKRATADEVRVEKERRGDFLVSFRVSRFFRAETQQLSSSLKKKPLQNHTTNHHLPGPPPRVDEGERHRLLRADRQRGPDADARLRGHEQAPEGGPQGDRDGHVPGGDRGP